MTSSLAWLTTPSLLPGITLDFISNTFNHIKIGGRRSQFKLHGINALRFLYKVLSVLITIIITSGDSIDRISPTPISYTFFLNNRTQDDCDLHRLSELFAIRSIVAILESEFISEAGQLR
ncbi:hypothetical protein ASF08_04095 [Methylobacterium sp. Leaf85]|nr:hypothetical protein ASF08_04095 [Methylobacterium sp. Leaf85]